MQKPVSKTEIMQPPTWRVIVYFLGYLAWVHGRAVREGVQPHADAV